MADFHPYDEALVRYRAGGHRPRPLPKGVLEPVDLLREFHPDYHEEAQARLAVGPNRGERCQAQVADLLQSNGLVDEIDLAGAPVRDTDVVIVGGGGAGCAAALAAAEQGARVTLLTKLQLGDSNTVMAEGGMQAAVGADDTPQLHYDDTLQAGQYVAERALVAQMVMDGPGIVRWLIQLGMQFDQAGSSPFGDLLLKRPGGGSVPRILSFRDYTGLELMRVLREAVSHTPGIEVTPQSPVVELLSDERGQCAGVVAYSIAYRRLFLIRAQAVILATGGIGRIHLAGFPTSNHFGATGDGLALAYRLGARLRELDSYQFHPTGLAYPRHLVGGLVSEAARSAGATLLNGFGERFVDELQTRDVVAAAIIRECREGRGIMRDGQMGVLLDTPGLEAASPGTLARFGGLRHLAARCGHDPAETPFLVYPTLHYQNGGIAIAGDGATNVPGLFCAGEVTGGIHGRNRLMGNSLLDILSFGQRAGAAAAVLRSSLPRRKVGIGHLADWQRELTLAGLSLTRRSPRLFPDYANFELRAHVGAKREAS
ncbi:FAD-dependent oxidoreductase [Candidatus Chloroploca asiatica]|uniref:L-aspartate oxidase n=1 Tax=Candidatus Chloroploca asiatica TaxID=1506545 RepID=A0A2H3KRL0_9CHLR|nr:FAD-dependent oxidoreductase [Candidatus Chloroploca asiatica]PDV97849.1 L-aspartate oxidase [Candidatus Chloroploca asiatica]